MYVTKLELWNDTGFVENSAEYPNLSDTLTNPDLTYTDLHPAKEDLFSYFKIKGVSYETLISVSYARVTYDNISYPVYMWVDSVACVSDSPNKLTTISCHVDLWRTYLGDASLGYGLITKRIRGTADPIQPCPYRYRLPGEYRPFSYTGPGNNLYWVIVTYTAETTSTTGEVMSVTLVRQMIFPVDPGAPTVQYTVSNGTESAKCPSMADLVSGKFDEVLGISATAVTSAFVSPYPPLAVEKVEGTTVTYRTSSSSESHSVTQPVQAPKYISALSLEGKNYWQEVYFNWADSDGNSGSSLQTTAEGCADWMRDNSGYVGDPNISATINGNATDFLWHYDIQAFIKDALGDQYKPVAGDTFTISGGYYNANWTYSTSDWYKPSATGTYMANAVFTYGADGVWSNPDVTSDNVVFGAVPNCSFTFNESSLAFVVSCVKTKGDYGYSYSGNADYPEFTVTFDEVMTTDTREWVFTDMTGTPIGTLPWGIPLTSLNGRVVLTSTSGYVEFRESIDSHAKGTNFSIPLMAVDITSNSWSDYVYSGQRDYDISQRQIAAERALVSGVTGGLSNAFSTGVMAGLGGAGQGAMNKMNGRLAWARDQGFNASGVTLYGNKGQQARSAAAINKAWSSQMDRVANALNGAMPTAMGAGAASVGMMGASLAGAVVDYAAAQYFNGQLQDAEDTLQAKQIDSITTPGNGWDWVWHGRLPGFITLVPDDYSLTNFENTIRLNGITCSEPTADCSAYKDYTGPVQIQNLIVTGSIPVQARYLIANTYAKGIRMKCVNEKPDYDMTADTFTTDTSIKAGTYVFYNNTGYRYKINCVADDEIREQYIVDAGQKTSITLVAGDVISTLYNNGIWVANQRTVNVL